VGVQLVVVRMPLEVHGCGARQAVAGDVVEREEAKTEKARRYLAFVAGDEETDRADKMRGGVEQEFALDDRFAHGAKLEAAEEAEATVDDLRGRRRRAGAKVALVAEKHRKPPPRRVAGDCRAAETTADDGDVVHPAQQNLSFSAVRAGS
jgi:hypothetical protein